jgi:hypothetical protein
LLKVVRLARKKQKEYMSITSEQIDNAIEYLNQSNKASAQARADRMHLEDFGKVILAKIQFEAIAEGMGVGQAASKALASDEYRIHLEGLKVAIENDEFHRNKRHTAETMVSAYQTQQANERAINKPL